MESKKPLITPDEAIKLGKCITLYDIYIANDIANEYMKEMRRSPTKLVAVDLYTFSYVWNAGRIQGVREERAKRKKIRLPK